MQIIKLHEDCQIVVGAKRALIIDFGRNKYFAIPLGLSLILQKYQGKQLSNLVKDFDTDIDTIEDYLDFLINQELIFFCDTLEEYESFIPLSLQWDFPALISNIIWDLPDIPFDYSDILNQIELLGSQHISFRLFKTYNINQLNSLLGTLEDSSICSIEIAAPFDTSYTDFEINSLCLNHPRLNRLILFDDYSIKLDEEILLIENCIIIKSKKHINSSISCGIVHRSYFAINIPHFTEAQHHNTCLNRKISIDAEGNIKNCPSMAKSYGNIKDTKLIDVVNNPDFQKVWHIKKDEITKCKDCEFRHICTDCRAYIENPEDQYSAPLKCGYNPYTCEWEEWSTNPLKQKAIEYYGMQELIKSVK
ncbi:MAG: grasp-with-spasm system SPASM domain peptide maturase [Chitinophagaceae bacterium]|jgi:SPASM domain peptide maturase of grasp-with-spasm system